MKRCIFCLSHPTKPSAEHVFPRWVSRLFPITTFKHSRRIHHDEAPVAIWSNHEIDIKVKAVCETCNSGWMSDLESKHAKPAIADMIVRLDDVAMTPQRLFAIAAFGFKTAAIVAAMGNASNFFLPSELRRFAKTLKIPEEVHIFVASYFGERLKSGDLSVARYESTLPTGDAFNLYVVTWRAGHFILQVVNPRIIITPGWKFENYALVSKFSMDAFVSQIWPSRSPGPYWPPPETLGDYSFKAFCKRWKDIQFTAS